ncbi:quinone-dependent dihydroorotate dehydrogenase [Actinobaculum sp. 352]|uniref:quinone-dependent dihydroorotate dehydrogenase n=1 Tax=Actinobaculum sp. 352 TaxID=2490946 RepID=UPI000F7ECB34|nr:quinone-dependent dihydroorotate dehydrogenase [Actinobaculum sp. 352]RTE48761.1 quinone-dependent dihydroorotate dehydrogenase [Actinobaculum sp. 352]
MYRSVYDHLLVHTDPEQAHHCAMRVIGAFGRSPLAPLAAATIGWRGGEQLRGLLARPLPGRVGLAAGQDKDASAILGTVALGFAFTEIGTITPLPQPGNDRPRLWRIPQQNAFRNRMGFNNPGADVAAQRLAELRGTKRGRAAVVGVNIGKNKWVSAADAPADYATCAWKLARWADYLVINVSSPNTPGLRDLQAVDALRPIVREARQAADAAAGRRVPLLVKLAPDLLDDDIAAIATLVQIEDLDGVVAANTTIEHGFGEGGLSGAPLFERAVGIVSALRRDLGPDRIIIGVGGIFSVDDANRMINAGADLLEILTSFVYRGPTFPGRLNRALARPTAA